MAGTIDAGLDEWILSHCPSEFAWGIPSKEYVTALPQCSALEPHLKRFEINTLKIVGLAAGQK